MYYSIYNSPIGPIRLICNDICDKLVNLSIGNQYLNDGDYSNTIKHNSQLDIFKIINTWLDAYFNHENPSIDNLPLDLKGTDFQLAVWKILTTIKYGEVLTYGEIAKMIAQQRNIVRMSSQAVGNAVGNNPISIIVPCHRVVGTDNKLTGYNGGIDLKIKLLRHEGIKTIFSDEHVNLK